MITKKESSRRTHGGIGLVVTLILSLFSTSVATAQLPTATILGVVKDATGAVVPGASLTARYTDTGQTRTTVSAGDGSYRFPALAVGNYEVHAEQSGFQTAIRNGLRLTVGQEAVVNFTLEVGAVTQTIAVTAEAPLVNTTSGSLGGLVDERKVADLPLNGRNYIDLTLLQTGIQESKVVAKGTRLYAGNWFSSNGAPLKSNNYMLDGTMMSTVSGGTTASVSGQTLGVEGIREYRVLTNFFPAEYGMNVGSQMIIVSKSGTNTFHGSLFEYLRNSALDARNFFDYRTPITPRRLPAFARNNFGAAFGGPIQKGKTFFFATYEGVRERLGETTVSRTLPASAKVDGGLVPAIHPAIKPFLVLYPVPNLPNDEFTFPHTRPTREDFGQMRLDRTFSESDTAFVRHTITDAELTEAFNWPNFLSSGISRNQFGTLSENHVFSPTTLNTFRFSFSRTSTVLDSIWPRSEFGGPEYVFVPAEREMGVISISGLTSLGAPGTNPRGNTQTLFAVSDDVFFTHGRSSWKFGTLINSYRQYTTTNTFRGGEANFANVTSFLRGQPNTIMQRKPGSTTFKTWRFYTLSFYVQNDLRVRQNLTLNLGLRYEFQTQMNEVHGESAALRDLVHDTETTVGIPFVNPTKRAFSPRFGFAWDVTGDGKTAVRGGFGLLYDLANAGGTMLQAIGGMPPFGARSTLTNPVFTVPFQIPDVISGRTIAAVEFRQKQPHLLQYNLTLSRQLPLGTALTLAYAGSRGINLWQIKEGNPTIPSILPDGRKFWTGNEPRVNPAWNDMDTKFTAANSFYNSLQFGLTKSLSQELQFQSSFTWSKIIDDPQGQNNNEYGNATYGVSTDPWDRTVDRAVSNFDVPLNWRFNAIYRLSDLIAQRTAAGKVLNGWTISSIVSLQSGQPFTPSVSANRSRSRNYRGGASGWDRPNLVSSRSFSDITKGVSTGCGAIPAGTPIGTPDLWYDPCAFAVQPIGFLGNSGRNILRLPGFAVMDFSLMKNTPLRFLGEAGSLEFRAEFFNLLNRANFGVPSRIVYAARAEGEAPLATAGRISETLSTSRQIQLAVKVLF